MPGGIVRNSNAVTKREPLMLEGHNLADERQETDQTEESYPRK